IFVFHQIKKHYLAVGEQLNISTCEPILPIEGNIIIVPVAGITHVVENSLNYAKSLSPQQIIAVYVAFERKDEQLFAEKWKKWQPDVRLVTLHSQYRSITQPLSKFISKVESKANESNYRVTVLIPQFIPKKGWHNILHNQSSLLIRSILIYRKDVVVTTVPYRFKK
ncbi:MAG: amino acid permease, partial [Paenisporosarcina sp.]